MAPPSRCFQALAQRANPQKHSSLAELCLGSAQRYKAMRLGAIPFFIVFAFVAVIGMV
jgi:hypothetical protein